jgi:alkylation response protein AidB-like acyl-CoA dehydrogenase
MDSDLLQHASTPDEEAFAHEAIAFLVSCAQRRRGGTAVWGAGEERLALFHETSGPAEKAEADAARSWQRQRWDAGFGWLTGPVEHGGRGLQNRFDRLYRRIEAAFEIPDMAPLRIGLGWVGPTIVSHGTAQQVAGIARELHRGEAIACALLSEPDAGSDLAGVRTSARRVADGWVITGQKVWTSNAQFADVGLALVRTDPAASKHAGLTAFLLPMHLEGVDVRPIRQLTGGSSFCEVFLSDVVVPDSCRLGDVGHGWEVATRAVGVERQNSGDRTHELLTRAFELLQLLAVQVGLEESTLHSDDLARLYTNLTVARKHQERLQGMPPHEFSGTDAAIENILVAWNLRDVGDLAAELLGPAFAADTGGWGTFAWTRWSLGALGYRIAGGTEEVLKTMLAERVLGLPRDKPTRGRE